MAELTWGQILGVELNNALNKAMRSQVDLKVAVKMISIAKELKSEQDKANKMREILQDRFFDKVAHPDGRVDMKEKPGKEEEIKKAQEEFAATSFKMKSAKLSTDELTNAGLAPIELMALEPILANPIA